MIGRWRRGGSTTIWRGACLALGLMLTAGCADDDGDVDSGPVPDDLNFNEVKPDAIVCKRPPSIQSCTGPGTGACPTKALCLGCTCSGLTPVYACDGFTHDCRWFCTGCYPADYTICDKNAPKDILGICGYCFADSGPPGKCNVAFADAGAKPDAGSNKDQGKK